VRLGGANINQNKMKTPYTAEICQEISGDGRALRVGGLSGVGRAVSRAGAAGGLFDAKLPSGWTHPVFLSFPFLSSPPTAGGGAMIDIFYYVFVW